MVRIDMCEYMEKHAVSRLIGAPPGYVGYDEGGQLTEAVRRRPYSVVLFDEIEKAHPDVFNVLLQLLDDGRLTDGQGRTVDFRNTVVIMTSNVGSQFLEDWTDLGARDKVMAELRRTFRPEFLNRIDDIVVFHRLGRDEIDSIVDLQLERLRKLLRERELDVELTPEARTFLGERGYDPAYGARPLKRAIMRYVQDPLAKRLLAGDFQPGDTIVVGPPSAGGDALAIDTEAGATRRSRVMMAKPCDEGSLQDAGRRRERRRRRDQEGLPQAGQEVSPRRHRRRQEEDRALQGDQRGVRGARRREEARGVRPAQARAGPARRHARGVRCRRVRAHVRRRARDRRAAASSAATSTSATSSPACSAAAAAAARHAGVGRPGAHAPGARRRRHRPAAGDLRGGGARHQADRPHRRRRRRSRSPFRPASRTAGACAFPGKGAAAPRQGGVARRSLPGPAMCVPIRTCAAHGDDIELDLPVTIREAVLGAKVEVPTVEGPGHA